MTTESTDFYPDLLAVQEIAYNQSNLIIQNFIQEAESEKYSACRFELNNQRICYRLANITPKKIGQFVTVWKRNSQGITVPYDVADNFDFFIITVIDGNNFGQFIFPKKVLHEKGFVSKEQQGGKRGMRVYPAWDKPQNAQALKTQKWQLLYFFEIKPMFDLFKFKQLFNFDYY